MGSSNSVAHLVHFKKKQTVESKPGRMALIFGAAYIVLASIYIIISTQYVASHADSVDVVTLSELQKGLLFVWVTGILMAAFVWIMFTKKDGTGLGMLSIRACIEAHSGEIEIDQSEELGGAKFTITLPRKVEAEEKPAVA